MEWTRSDKLRLFHILEGAYHRGLLARDARKLMKSLGIEWISYELHGDVIIGRGLGGGDPDDFVSSYGEPLFCYEDGDNIMMYDPVGVMKINKDLAGKILVLGLP